MGSNSESNLVLVLLQLSFLVKQYVPWLTIYKQIRALVTVPVISIRDSYIYPYILRTGNPIGCSCLLQIRPFYKFWQRKCECNMNVIILITAVRRNVNCQLNANNIEGYFREAYTTHYGFCYMSAKQTFLYPVHSQISNVLAYVTVILLTPFTMLCNKQRLIFWVLEVAFLDKRTGVY